MYINNNNNFRPLSKKEIILMAKQLGMMHILYAARKDFWEMQNDLKIFARTPESYVIDSLDSKRAFFDLMDKWEKRYKIDKRAFIRHIRTPG